MCRVLITFVPPPSPFPPPYLPYLPPSLSLPPFLLTLFLPYLSFYTSLSPYPSPSPLSLLPPSLGATRGQISIVAEEVQDSKFTIHMQLAASKLDKKDFFGKVC